MPKRRRNRSAFRSSPNARRSRKIFGRHHCRGRPFSRDAFRFNKVINEPDFLPLHGNGDVARLRRFPTRAIVQENYHGSAKAARGKEQARNSETRYGAIEGQIRREESGKAGVAKTKSKKRATRKQATRPGPKRPSAKKTAAKKAIARKQRKAPPAETILLDVIEEPAPGVLVVTEFETTRTRSPGTTAERPEDDEN